MGGAFGLLGRRFRGAKSVLLTLGLICTLAGQAQAKLETDASTAFYQKALEQAKHGDLPAAVIELKNALQQDPTNDEARLLLGSIYLLLGDGASAEHELRAAELYGINSTRTVVPLGRALLLQGRFADVLSGFDPNSYGPDIAFDLRLLHADARAGLSQFAEARKAYEEAREGHAADARIPLGLARIDLLEGKFDAAEAHAAEAVALSPDVPEATFFRAEAQRQKGDTEASIASYRSLLDGRPLPIQINARAHLGLATALMALSRNADADTEATAFQSVMPNSPLGPYLRAMIKLRARDFVGARQILQGSAGILDSFTPSHFLFGIVNFASGDFETARAWLNRHLEAHPENLPARKLQGATLLRLNAIPDAIAFLEPGLKQAPDDPQLLLLLGNAYVRSGRAAEATALLQRAAELAPKDPRVLGQLAISQLAEDRGDEALAVLNTSLDLGADTSAIGYALAFTHLRLGDFEAALKVAQDLRQRFPDSAVAANLEGATFAALKRASDAQEAFEAALKIDPDFHEARANLAALKLQAGDLDGAEAEYSRIVHSDEKNVPAFMGLADVARHRGDTKASRNWLLKAVEADPNAINPTITLAEDYVATGEFPAAISVLDSLTHQDSVSPKVLLALARVQNQAGRVSDAIDTYRRLVKASNGNAEAQTLLAQAYLAAGETAMVRSVLEESLATHPDHRPTAEALVQLIARTKGQEAGFAYAKELRVRYSYAAWSDQLIGDLDWRAGRLEEAIAEYETGWAKKPSAALAIALSRARTQLAMQQHKDGKDATAPLQQWIVDHPSDDTVRLALAETQLKLGDLTAARTEYEALKATQTNNPTVWNNLAWLYEQAGDKRALEHAERALELSPDEPQVMDTLGWILVADGQVDRAAALLRQAYVAAPESTNIAFHYAAALHKGGDDETAKQVLQALLMTAKPFAEKPEAEDLLNGLSQ